MRATGPNGGFAIRREDIRADLFWRKVRKTDGCWEWTASGDRVGYGRFSVKLRLFPAHRVAYALVHGETPAGLVVCHACDNRRCVNPAHLWIGTQRENLDDAVRKGRLVKRQTAA